MTQLESALTFGDVAEAIREREHRVRRAIQRLRIQPLRKAGNAFLYPPDTIERVRHELAAIDVRRATSQQPERRGDGDV